jgi:AhpD family alkylhydroperoxidase
MSEAMDVRTKELVAIGASIGAHCQPCLEYHVTKARELGIDADLIHAAIDMGHRVEKGAMDAMREFEKGVVAMPPSAGSKCCAGATGDAAEG